MATDRRLTAYGSVSATTVRSTNSGAPSRTSGHRRPGRGRHQRPLPPLRRRLHEAVDQTGWRFTDDELFSVESDALDVHVDFADRRLTLRGEIVLSTVETLADLISMLIEVNPGITSIDLSNVSRIDPTGFACLADISGQLVARGAGLIVLGPKPLLDRLFDVTNLLGLFDARPAN